MKKLLLILLCLPMIGFGQKDLTGLLFQLIDSKDSRSLLEDKGWKTTSIDIDSDEYGISFNEFVLSKDIDFSEGNSSRCYFTINEYSSSSNIIMLKLYNKDFYNQFKQIIVNSEYNMINQDVEHNTIQKTYKKDPLYITFKEELNNHYQITLFNNIDKQRRYKSIRNKNGFRQRCITGNCNNGYGIMTYNDGDKYEGEFKDNKYNGQGTFTWVSGNKYIGEFKNDKKHGYGTYTYDNISNGKGGTWSGKYIGYWEYGRRNGKGTNTYANGNKYEGEYKDDKYNGQGTFTWVSGNKYIGEFKNDKRHGYGTYIKANGAVKKGRWKNGDFLAE